MTGAPDHGAGAPGDGHTAWPSDRPGPEPGHVPDLAAECGETARDVRALLCFGNVLTDEVGAAWLGLLGSLAAHRGDHAESYARSFALLAEEAASYPEPFVGDAWQNHLLDRLLGDDNPFSRRVRLASSASPDASLVAAARHDMRALRAAFSLAGERLAGAVAAADSAPLAAIGEDSASVRLRGSPAAREVVPWTALTPLGGGPVRHGEAALRLKHLLATSGDWDELLGPLVRHFATVGAGPFGRYRAFRWIRVAGRGELEGVECPDPITLDELVSYDSERALLLRNTEHFVAGFPANNVLIYGDRGTGKSSTIKALLNEPTSGDLRLIEVPKQHLADFPEIVRRLRRRPERFILFVDDLSFDEHETQYRELKAILEGGIEARPENVVLYATSNRRHLVQERFADRAEPGDEVRGQDTLQEKLSLGDRFGITATFLAPDQDRYLAIVAALAHRRGLVLPANELRRRALQWAAWHNGRSGRCARQLVDHLAGELGMRRLGGSLSVGHEAGGVERLAAETSG